jgi:hypothetical protein
VSRRLRDKERGWESVRLTPTPLLSASALVSA